MSKYGDVTYSIDKHREAILYSLEKCHILLIVGASNMDKSASIAQYLLNSGVYNNPKYVKNNESDGCHDELVKHKQICVTHSKEFATFQLAQQISNNLDCELGTTVGFSNKFKSASSEEQTVIMCITESVLMNEMLYNPMLDNYSVIIIDAVQERQSSTDLLLGLLKCILKKRKDLKLIICSTSPDIDSIINFFTDPQFESVKPFVISLEGAKSPMRIYYKQEPVANYLDSSIETVKSIHESSRLSSGKVLVFLTGQDEVNYVCERLKDYSLTITDRLDVQQLKVLPLHTSLKPEEISKALDNYGRATRLCIVSTNIAENSLTIDDVAHVIDCGFSKMKVYNHHTGLDSLIRVPISKETAKRRANQCRHSKPVHVYRLYTEEHYNQLENFTVPEIQRASLLETVLTLKCLQVEDITRFPLISPMPRANLIDAIETLYALEAINLNGELTSIGEIMATINVEPRLSRMLVSSETSCCTQEACKIVGVLQVKEIFSKTSRHASDLWHNESLVNLCSSEGDIISYLNIINGFISSHKNKKWAERRNLNYQALINAIDIATNLELQLERNGISLTSSSGRVELIQKSVLSGLFTNAAYLHSSGDYKTIKGDHIVYVHPTSVLSEIIEKPKLVVFSEILNTTKPFMRHIMSVDQSLLLKYDYYTYGVDPNAK